MKNRSGIIKIVAAVTGAVYGGASGELSVQ